jgi:hypothetical protein
VRLPSLTEINVIPTAEGIPTGNTLDDMDSEPTDDIAESAKADENIQILEMERRDFDEEDVA